MKKVTITSKHNLYFLSKGRLNEFIKSGDVIINKNILLRANWIKFMLIDSKIYVYCFKTKTTKAFAELQDINYGLLQMELDLNEQK